MRINIFAVPQGMDLCNTPDAPGVIPEWSGTREEFIAGNSEAEDLVALASAMEDGDAAYYGGGAAPLIWIQAVVTEEVDPFDAQLNPMVSGPITVTLRKPTRAERRDAKQFSGGGQ